MSSEKPVHVPRNQYPAAMHPQVLTAGNGEYRNDEEIRLLDYWRIIVTRRWTIFAILATIVTFATIYTFKQTPAYEATANIQIDKENPNVLSFKDVYEIETASDDTLRTQFEVLKSRRLARSVIEDLKLDKNEEFRPKEPSGVAAIWRHVTDLFRPKPPKFQNLGPVAAHYRYLSRSFRCRSRPEISLGEHQLFHLEGIQNLRL